ncbi:MAG TPA: biopolymer transporter ExbD [Sandaracinaceae bacterium LLY-WYZ-13_1]|nr:biopolymer transporter ExbD [Sandaracinaceae bacterium LLY-WYZ-13_1]
MGGGAQQGDDDEIITAINVTPLVDIVLVLLIILMVTASYIVSKSIPMDLPNAQSGEEGAEPRTLTVSIDEGGQLYVDAEEASWDELEAAARRLAAEEDEPRAVIAADRDTTHGEFIRVVDVLRNAGVVRYAINVNPQDLEREGE